jgi:hypothetical protein
MKYKVIAGFLLASFLSINFLNAQDDASFSFTNKVYDQNIKTVQITVLGVSLSDPVIQLNGVSQFELSFDDLDADVKRYDYSLELCNWDWTPSDLSTFDYLQGFNNQRISNFQHSFNTAQQYTHYWVDFPNSDLQVKKTGNYLLKVFDDNDPDHPVITWRILFYDSKMGVLAESDRPYDPKYSDEFQQINYTVLFNGVPVTNPINEIHTLVLQNFRWDNALSLPPLFVQPTQLDYHYQKENLFPAGKEFRHFDIRSIRFLTERIQSVTTDNGNVVTLVKDTSRAHAQYFYEKDINGKYVVGYQEGNNPDVQSDYAYVNFFMPFSPPLEGGQPIVFGTLTNWGLDSESVMKYDATKHGYTAQLYLKQGYYNYDFAWVDEQKPFFDLEEFEGNWFETENNYTILVYYRPAGERYDQLIGLRTINSLYSNK